MFRVLKYKTVIFFFCFCFFFRRHEARDIYVLCLPFSISTKIHNKFYAPSSQFAYFISGFYFFSFNGLWNGFTPSDPLRPPQKLSPGITTFFDPADAITRKQKKMNYLKLVWHKAIIKLMRGLVFKNLHLKSCSSLSEQYRNSLSQSSCFPISKYLHVSPRRRDVTHGRLLCGAPERVHPARAKNYPTSVTTDPSPSLVQWGGTAAVSYSTGIFPIYTRLWHFRL